MTSSSLDLTSGWAAPIQAAFNVGSDGILRTAGLIDTVGLTIVGNIELSGQTTLDTKGTAADGPLSLTGNIDGAFGLTLNSGSGNASIKGEVGASTRLTNFISDAAGTLQFAGGTLAAKDLQISDPFTFTGDTTIIGETLALANSVTFIVIQRPARSATDRKRRFQIPDSANRRWCASLRHGGSGLTTLRGVNTYTGDTTISLGDCAG